MSDLIIQLDDSATEEEVNEVTAACRAIGIDPEVTKDWQKEPETGNGAFWMVHIPITAALTAFVMAFFGKAGQDAWDGLKSFVANLRRARRSSRVASKGWVEFQLLDGTTIMIGDDLSDEQIDALRNVNWRAHMGGQFTWRDDTKEWFDGWREFLKSLSDDQLRLALSDAVQAIPSVSESDAEAHRRAWGPVIGFTDEMKRRYPPNTEPRET
jgi:hypothetical protein